MWGASKRTDRFWSRAASTTPTSAAATCWYNEIPVEISGHNAAKYYEAEQDLIKFLKKYADNKKVESAKRAEAIMKLNILRKLVVEAKANTCLEWIEEFLESSKKLVVFAWHQNIVNLIYEKFGSIAVKIDGSVSSKDRQTAVESFQNDEKIRLFVGNIKAAGTGLTLTAASDTCTIELSWSPSDLAQAEDRVHRIGQKNGVCNYYLLAKDTIDDYMMNLIDEKKKVFDMLMDGKETDNDTLLNKLMERYLETEE